jgi:hypothetical protein
MKIRVTEEQKIIQKAFNVVLADLKLPKVMRFWAFCQLEEGNYL